MSDIPITPVNNEDYAALPWYRKSSHVSPMTLVGLFCGPVILAVCVIVLTGDVYYKTRDEAGRLRTWGWGNKIAAVIVLGLQLWFTGYHFGWFGPLRADPQIPQ